MGEYIAVLTGCASQYSNTEQELTHYLSNAVHFETTQGNSLFGVEIKINNLDVTLGRKTEIMAAKSKAMKGRRFLLPECMC
jgi:hypothetical protein